MAGVENRPYAGTWQLNNRTIVKYTPDALVFINGDTSVPGCPRCRGRVDIQQYVTSLNVEAGTEPGSHSATINLSLPRVQGQQVFIDGYNILRPGLEVHVFMRGYFAVRGMFKHLPDPQAGGNIAFPNPTDNDKLDLSKYASYPYYPVFHGVVTSVSYDYSDGFYTGSLNCASLLHFWNYQNIVTAGAWMAQDRKPHNDPSRPTLFGHNFNNVHPFGIIYTLYRDVAGAAAGVEFALSEESNVAAASTEGGRQIYDQMTVYWEQRFKTRIQSLRMYGVNGQLFNAAQQAWIGSASTRDVDQTLTSPTYSDGASTRTEWDPTSARLSVAKALGLGSAGIDFIYSPLIAQDDELVNLSILDMFAFSQSIAELGPGNVWQTTYQTKMDVAEQVIQVTGYELYQDVDGDIVFKPPFWNLDTAGNRYYRLEDQDIINISFTEKEPTATYIIVRGTWFGGLTDVVSNVNETGKRALYVDYKLVAKFGWRGAATLDITYATDPKVLFWIAVARLDMLNVDTFSASCTIPIRAELRPGYPVYVPFADCYYYISQLSHQFAFGGQCTTNLVLTCRRAKWHAPGFLRAPPEEGTAIDLIRLDRPDLPPRPLEVYDKALVANSGEPVTIPRIVGFPNVVMALDPQLVNPNFSVVGAGIDFINDTNMSADLLFSWLQRDVNSVNALEAVGFETNADGTQVIDDPRRITRFRLRTGPTPKDIIEFDLDDLAAALIDYYNERIERDRRPELDADGKVVTDPSGRRDPGGLSAQKNQALQDQNTALAGARAFYSAGKLGDPRAQGLDPNTITVAAHRGAADSLDARIFDEERKITQFTGEAGGNGEFLVMLFTALQPESNNAIRRKVDGIPASDVTLSYFEALSHLKAQFMCSTVTGNYRYFSSAHPNPEMQGMPIIEWDDGERAPTVGQGAAAQRSRGKRKRRRGRGKNRARARAINGGFESILGLPGWTDLSMALIEKESGFSTGRCNPGFTDRQQAKWRGEAWKPTGGRTGKGKPLTKKQAQAFLANRRKNWGTNPTWDDPDAWATGACGWYQQVPTTGMDGVSDRKSRYHNMDPRVALETPCITSGLEMALLYRVLTRNAAWNNLPPEQRTFLNMRRAIGGSLAQTSREAKAKVWTPQEARESLFNDDVGFKKVRTEAGAITVPTASTRKGGCDLRFKDPETGNVTRDVRNLRKKERRERRGFVSAKQKGFVGAGLFMQGLCKNGMTIDEAARFSQKIVPEAQWEAALRRFGGPRAGHRADPFIDLACKLDNEDPLAQQGADPEPVATEPTTTEGGGIQPQPGPSIRTTEVSTDVERTVVQFKKVASIPEGGDRAPEAELTLGKCSRGIMLALGAQRTPKVITTEQIQTISFVRHSSNKFTAVVGTSQTAGGQPSADPVDLRAQITKKFKEAATQLVSTGNETVTDAFEEVYEQMRADIVAVEFPVYENGNEVKKDTLNIQTFPEVLFVSLDKFPASVRSQIEAALDVEGDVPIAELTFNQIGNVPGYAPQGQAMNGDAEGDAEGGGNKYERAINKLAADYALSVTREIENTLLDVQKRAQEPSVGRQERQDAVRTAFDSILGTSVSQETAASSLGTTDVVEKTPKPGKDEKPVHSPVFPVSDEKGYEHYGAYRYGRGLTAEPGGTFEFIHSGQDPFQNVTAQTAEEFLRVFTLKKSGKIDTSAAAIAGIKDAVARIVQAFLSDEPQSALGEDQQAVAEKLGLSQRQIEEVEGVLLDFAEVVAALAQTAAGREALREMLLRNGDDPNLIDQESFDITDTQLARNFVNFAATYGKSPVFKTTVANAAYQLSDLTSHLLARAGNSCVCRGSYSDVVMAAYARLNFVTVEGIDSRNHPATAFQSEQIIKAADQHSVQQQEYRGQRGGEDLDAAAQQRSNATGAVGAPLPTSGSVAPAEGNETVSPENPPTTADPNDLPTPDIEVQEGLDVPPGDVTELNGDPVLIGALEDMTGLSQQEMQDALNGDDPEALAELEESTGFSGAELQEILGGPQPTQEDGVGQNPTGETPTGQNLGDSPGLSPQDVANEIGGGTTPDQVRNVLLRGTPEQIAGLEAETGLSRGELYSIFGFGG